MTQELSLITSGLLLLGVPHAGVPVRAASRHFSALGSYEIYRIDSRGGHAQNLTRSGADEESPALSPDGKRLAFVRDYRAKDSVADLWTMRPDGSHQLQLTRTRGALEREPAWSPDGRQLAYERQVLCSQAPRSGCQELMVINAEGTQLQRVAANVTEFAWSPDSRQIAFAGDLDRYGITATSVSIVGIDGSGIRDVFRPKQGIAYGSLSWSRDGRRIGFVRTIGNAGAVYTARTVGTDVRRITVGYEPAWSPDRTRLLVARGAAPRTALYRVALGSGSARKLRARDPSEWSWSPGGMRIAYVSGSRLGGIRVIDANGRHERGLAGGLVPEQRPPVWAPDGRAIFYAGRR